MRVCRKRSEIIYQSEILLNSQENSIITVTIEWCSVNCHYCTRTHRFVVFFLKKITNFHEKNVSQHKCDTHRWFDRWHEINWMHGFYGTREQLKRRNSIFFSHLISSKTKNIYYEIFGHIFLSRIALHEKQLCGFFFVGRRIVFHDKYIYIIFVCRISFILLWTFKNEKEREREKQSFGSRNNK